MAAPRLQVRYPNRRALLSNVRTERSVVTLFVPGTQQVSAGSEVLLELSVDHTELRFELPARVRLQFSDRDPRGAGLGVAFLGEQKRAAGQMLAACAATSEGGSALDTRLEVDVRCLINLHGKKLRGAVRDVSSTGAFVGTPLIPELRGAVELTLQLEPLFGIWGGSQLKARVVWVGEKHGVHGFGACFLEESVSVRARLEKHLPLLAGAK